MCVYDDLRGWNTLPYLGHGEFYCEYGDFNYEITVPWNMIVAGSGELVNQEEVLTKNEISRLKQAATSDKTLYIIRPEEVGTLSSRPVQNGMLTWQFKMENSRDVSWAASKAYIWDAARINLPEGKSALSMSVYPIESSGDTLWNRSTEYVKYSVEYFSKEWYPIPLPCCLQCCRVCRGNGISRSELSLLESPERTYIIPYFSARNGSQLVPNDRWVR